MTESQLFEILGRKDAALIALNAEYDSLLAVLVKLSSGEIDLKQIVVNTTARSWAIQPLKEGDLTSVQIRELLAAKTAECEKWVQEDSLKLQEEMRERGAALARGNGEPVKTE
jgi:hypothetical protein